MTDLSDSPTTFAEPIGTSVPRGNARRAVEGRGRHVDDLTLPRMVHVAFLRSPHAHARIVSIDTTEAKAHPGVVSVMTGTELAEHMTPWTGTMQNAPTLKSPPQYAMAVDRAVWQGEPVVAVAAETRAIAEDAAELIGIEWEPLPVVAELETALNPATPVLHADLGSNKLYERAMETGEVDPAFAAAHKIVEGTFRFGRHTGVTPEARAVLAAFDPSEGKLTVHYGGQAPHMMQVLLSRHLGLEERDIRVIAQDVGGSYGVKSHLYGDEVTAILMSMRLGRPVKFVADRLESFLSDIHARDHIVTARLAVTEDGKIAALDLDDLVGAGAYSHYPRTSAIEANQVINITAGPYDLANYRARATVVFQNKVPISQYRGVGHPVGILVCEALIERAADALGMDSVELRRRNLVLDGSYPRPAPSGVGLNDLSHQACLEKLVEVMDYDRLRAEQETLRKQGIHRGIGIASFIKGTNPGPLIYGSAGVPISALDGCTLRFEPSGAITCLTGITEQGQGTETIMAQVVAATVGVAVDHVSVLTGDTDLMPYGGGTYGSRGAGIGGEAAHRAATKLRAELLEVAGVLLQAEPETLDIVNGEVVDSGGARLSLAELGNIAFYRSGELPNGYHPSLVATERFRVTDYVFTNGVHGCQIELDPETGVVRLLDYWAVEDCGRLINPRLVEEQVRGAIVQGLGDAFYEHCIYDADGQLQNGTLADYLVPMAGEMPDIKLWHIETPTSESGLGAKGAGESGTAAAPGTVFNAVNDALKPLGAHVEGIPITPADVLTALGRG